MATHKTHKLFSSIFQRPCHFRVESGYISGIGNFQSIRLINYRVIATHTNLLDAQAFVKVLTPFLTTILIPRALLF